MLDPRASSASWFRACALADAVRAAARSNALAEEFSSHRARSSPRSPAARRSVGAPAVRARERPRPHRLRCGSERRRSPFAIGPQSRPNQERPGRRDGCRSRREIQAAPRAPSSVGPDPLRVDARVGLSPARSRPSAPTHDVATIAASIWCPAGSRRGRRAVPAPHPRRRAVRQAQLPAIPAATVSGEPRRETRCSWPSAMRPRGCVFAAIANIATGCERIFAREMVASRRPSAELAPRAIASISA